ncbi:MAG: ABC transporter substrate-binding protein [Bacteroidota bacterium]
MTKQSNSQFLISLCLMALILSSCKYQPSKQDLDPIQLGGLFSLTGAKSDMGIPSSKGAQLAVDLINEKGGIRGRNLELIVKDGKSNPQVGKEMVSKILQDAPKTAAFMGFCDSDLAEAAALVAKQNSRLFLTSGATSPLLPAQVTGSLFLACFGDNVQAAAAAEWAFNELNARSAAVIFDSTSTYTKLLQQYFKQSFESLGGQVISVQTYHPTDMTEIGQNLAETDFVFFSAGSAYDALKGIQILRRAGIDVPVIGGDSYDSETVWEAHPEIEDIFYTTHSFLGIENSARQVQNFRAAYQNTYGGNEPDAFAALNFDAINLLAEAIENTENIDDPKSIQSALAKLSDFKGVTGTISFKNGQQIPQKSVTIIEVTDGHRTLNTQLLPKRIPKP